jgi:Phage major capsid protein E
MFPDIFNDDAFTLVSLTAAINNIDHVPGRAGDLVFAGVGEGVASISVAIESKDEALTLIQTSLRGAPAPKETRDKGKLRHLGIPQIKLEETIGAHSIQGVRQFGSTDQLLGVQTVVNQQMAKMTNRHDLTLEYHRLGALQGQILDADGALLLDLFEAFGVDPHPEADFSFLLDDATEQPAVRTKAAEVRRLMTRSAKTVIPTGARIWAFCGDEFFDALLEHPSIKEVYKGYEVAERRLGSTYVGGIFEFGDIFWENYTGTDDNSTVAIAPDECQFFWVGVPGLYAEYFAPADFLDTVNTVGLPRYARMAPDTRFNQYVELHTQQNPLPLCLRPKTLLRGSLTPATS